MKHAKFVLTLLDALCAGVLSSGAALVLLPAFGLQISPVLLPLAVLLSLCLFVLGESRPWAVSAVLAGGLLAVLACAALLGKTEVLASAVAEYSRWALEEKQRGAPQFPVYLVLVLPVAGVFYSLARLSCRHPTLNLWVVALLCAGLISYKAVYMPEGWLAPFLLLCAGLVLYLPRATLGQQGRLQAQVLAGLLALPVLGLAVLLGPSSDGQWRWPAVGFLVQDIQDFWEYHWGELPHLPLTSMRSMGLQPQKDRLGGDIEVNRTPVISSTQNLLLRGQAFAVYTGTDWEDSAPTETGNFRSGNFRFDSLFWLGRKSQAFGLNMPNNVSPDLLDDVLLDVDADLRTLRNFRSVFLPYRSETVEFNHNGDHLYFNMQGEAYWDSQQSQGAQYHVEGRTWNFRAKNFDRNLIILEKSVAYTEQDRAYDEAAGYCLQLPENLPEWVKELAGKLTAECRSPYAKAAALRDYLSETCEYTLTPGPTDSGQDFVAEFLTNRKGYCTYYASALTVLCRCAGIPARYVTGYGMAPEGTGYRASQATAHAWTEIYLNHIGWVPLDALTQDIFEQDVPQPEEALAGDGTAGVPVTPSPTPFDPTSGLWVEEPPRRGFNFLSLLWLLLPVLAAVGSVLFRRLRSRRYKIKALRARFSQPGQAADYCYTGILRLMRLLRLYPQEGETLLTFWQRASALLPQGADWQEAGRIMDQFRYGSRPPSWEEVAWLCTAYVLLESHIRKSKGLWGWLIV